MEQPISTLFKPTFTTKGRKMTKLTNLTLNTLGAQPASTSLKSVVGNLVSEILDLVPGEELSI